MSANAKIVAVDYDLPGPDIQGERVVILNTGTTSLDLTGWTLHDVAPERTHVYTFKPFSLGPGAQVRVWTKPGDDTLSDVFWGRNAAVWNNKGDTPTLHDPLYAEVSRFRYMQLPRGAGPLKLSVPAFWELNLPQPPRRNPEWQKLIDADSVVSIVVLPGEWPETAHNNPTFKAEAIQLLDTLPKARLRYVGTRKPNDKTDPDRYAILPDTDILARVDAWYGEFLGHIDGIYFDELVYYKDPDSVTRAVPLVNAFKQKYKDAKAMILAGQAYEEAVVSTPSIDWALLWEERYRGYPTDTPPRDPYLENFYPLVMKPKDPMDPNPLPPIPDRQDESKPIPSWWKDPKYRHKIAHTVHNCPESDRQHALGLANERNAGNVFVMDRRGFVVDKNGQPVVDQNGNRRYDLYDHLPPYWEAEVREAESYYDFGLDPQRILLAAHRYGKNVRNMLHAWPNFEQAWYPSNHMRGTFFLHPTPDAQEDVMPLGALAPYDIPAVWAAAHDYAQKHPSGFETALPTFEEALTKNTNLPGMRVILLKPTFPGLTYISGGVLVADTYEKPTFAEPGAVIRNVNRVASKKYGFYAAFPTFVPDDPQNPTGRTNVYACYGLRTSTQLSWDDVATPDYIQQLPL
jgi:hypothetical protein